MTNESAYIAISSLISLSGVCYLLFWRYRKYSVDKFRQEVFALRDELFDYAAEGHVPFDHPAYTMLRTTMNGFIRFGHRLSLWQFLFLAIASNKEERKRATEFESKFLEVTETLDEPTRMRMYEFRNRMDMRALSHIFTSAPELILLLLPLLIVLVALAALTVGMKRIHRTATLVLKKTFRGMDDTALIWGE